MSTNQGDFAGGPNPIFGTAPIQNSTWNLNQALRNIRILRDNQNNAWAFPVFIVNPQTSPITAGGNIGDVTLADGTTQTLARIANFGGVPTNESLSALGALLSADMNYLYRSDTGNFDLVEEATAMVHVFSTGAASTSVLATGGAAKKYKLFEAFGSYATTAAVAADSTTLNEVTSGAVITGFIAGAAAGYAFDFHFGNNGILQPNANNALQITTVAASSLDLTLVYGAAR